MEASATFEGDVAPAVDSEQSEHDILEQARKKFLLALDCDKEVEGHKERMKAAQKRSDDARAEAERLIMQRGQLAIPLVAAPGEPPCSEPDTYHDWQRIRVVSGIAFEDCSRCGLERTGAAEGDASWSYTKPEPAAT